MIVCGAWDVVKGRPSRPSCCAGLQLSHERVRRVVEPFLLAGCSGRHEIQRLIEELHDEYQSLTDGQVATYIPELGRPTPNTSASAW